ncbi:hypothetical protein ACL6C3_25130 [Capilliphycus salinus ALCB114379]|uniref:pPIWI_RE_Z domain-containing protein n=1 Tax=Capilliphycus salinus TaxID=2768948 RepID=UPI0039A6B972
MRDTSSWRRNITKTLRTHWSSTTSGLNPATFCDIELGLCLLKQLAPSSPAHALWVLLTGYPFPIPEAETWSQIQYKMLGNTRHILSQFRSEYSWKRALENYRTINEYLRGYEVDAALEQFSTREVSICSNREQIYIRTLESILPYQKESVKWATAGRYECPDGKYRATVNFPENLIFPPPPSHNLRNKPEKQPITVSWEDLLETARWMDNRRPQNWEKRLSKVRLELFDKNGNLKQTDALTFNGLMHLIGMVSAGKSTLMDVVTVWATRRGLHVTLVVGDVIGALNRAKLFIELGIGVAPVLGASNRERHTNRLHRVGNAENPFILYQEHPGFKWLSTACPLSELRHDVVKPFSQSKQPCLNLSRLNEGENNSEYSSEYSNEYSDHSKTYACSLYTVCPFHQAQLDLTQASVWIATPASLVYTRIPPQINGERIRFYELVYRRSDLVIVDEADQVQVQLDHLFSPSQKLFGPRGEGWFSQVQQPVVQELNWEGRSQLADPDVDSWCKAHEITQTVTSRIYALILTQNPALREWSQRGEYFTSWLILERVALTLSGASKDARNTDPAYRRLWLFFDRFIDDPLGDADNQELSELASQLILTNQENRVRNRLLTWIATHQEPHINLSKEDLNNTAVLLEFGLIVGVLENRLNQILRDWKQVEIPLKLEGQSSMLFHNPPRDYEAVMPASPMGNVLALQYVRSQDLKSGDLRFFKCVGVGRWLLLHLHELFGSDGILGPHVLLLSGTSWALKAPGYHLQVPVAGVLRSPDAELEAISKSHFEFTCFYDRENRPITISGTSGNGRAIALKELLNQLAQPGGLGGPSRLENERKNLPQGRQRILLLVGSYEQAKLAQEYLENVRQDWKGQIRRLVPDDDEFESQWLENNSSLQRGLVSQFASTGAWILIAPLMAIERGHNILNEDDRAAIGAVYFLVRPHPRPDDISYAIHSINRWAVEHYADQILLNDGSLEGRLTLEKTGKNFRDAAYKQWRYLLRLPMIYSTLPPEEREAVTWNQLVSIWQVIGRLIRGGSPARVFFCDAAFARRTALQDERGDEPLTSLLVSIKQVLRPYFISGLNPDITNLERELVQALYGPFYTAIENMGGIADEL